MIATWLVIKNENSNKIFPFLFAGFLLGIAFSLRFQTTLFIGGFGLALLIKKQWKQVLNIFFGFAFCIAIVQGATDMIIWHKPFIEIGEYIRYNIDNAETYGTQKWYNYLLLSMGILIPPISIFLLFGFLKSWQKHLVLFLPTFIFFVFHSSFPNKQERFILPAIPFIITLGSVGWIGFLESSVFWQKRKLLYRNCWFFFWILNTIPLIFVSTAYSHRSRVESMVYLSHKKDFRNLVVEESIRDDFTLPPEFYLEHWIHTFYVTSGFTIDSLNYALSIAPKNYMPNYAVFNQPDSLESRMQNLKRIFPGLKYETTIKPSFIDNVMHKLNPRNKNFTAYIYKIE
jgi:hypothetical protein